ncbi:hypothetical protein B566_EDAN009744 [Ephemera danica]|nr:hypothetical protein B566_EDAN009744 [Ephemera danica]
MSSMNSFCVNQDSECADLFCSFNVKLLFRTCNDFCEGESTQLPAGLECICLASSILVCPGLASSLLESEIEAQSLVLPTTEERTKRDVPTYWGAKIKSPELPQIIVYCTGEKTSCEMALSLCEQQNCFAGQCFFQDHCYFANPYINGVSECNDGSKPIGVETVEEREHIFFILNETYPGTQLAKVGTSGIVPLESRDGDWNGWNETISPEVVDVIDELEVQEYDQHLGITRDDCGEVVWEFFSSGVTPTITMCEIDVNALPSTTTDDTTTDDTTTTNEESTTTPSSTDDPNTCKEPCIKEGQYEELWECCPNTTCKKECPLNAKGDAVWFCAFNSTYITTVPDYSGCHNVWVDDLNNRIENHNISSWDLLKNTDLYATEDSLFGHEMTDVINFSNTSMSLLIDEQKSEKNSSMSLKLDERRYMAESTLRVIDRILKYNKQWEQLKEYEQVQLGMQMQNTTDFLGFSVTEQARLIGKPFFMVSEWPNSHMEAQYIMYDPNAASGPIVKYPMEPSYFSKGSIIEFRGPQWIKLEMNNFTVETVGNSLPMEIAEMIFPARYNSMEDSKKQLNSEMIALSMLNSDKLPLTSFPEESIWVTFVHEYESEGPMDSSIHRDLYPDEKPTAVLGSQQCAFWNASLSYNGQWDTAGCRLISHTKYETVCACNHLSSFALLMDVHDYVGVCIAVGVVLHYVFLAAFMWMAVEGHHLYRLVIRVFDSGKDMSRLYLIVAYGTPAIIVGVTGILALASTDKVYGADGLIWIRGWFSLSALLGITWLFGFVYMEWYYNLAYVFIVLTGLQGVFIFLSRVVFNDQVKSAFKRSAKKRSMMNRFYKLAWKNRSEGSSMQQSSWFLAGSSSSQLDLTSSSSYWDHTPSRRRSSITHPDSYTDPEKLSGSLMQHSIAISASLGQTVAHVDKPSSNGNSSWNILKRRHSKEEEDTVAELPPYYLHQSGDIQQAWGNRTDLDILTEIPEEDEEPSNSTFKY